MQGRCIQAPEKSNLVEGEIYFLFPHGGLAYNVSKFPRPGSHFGTYQKSRFEVIAEDATEVQLLTVEEEKHDEKYLARIVKPPSHFYLVGEEYIITQPDENGYYSVFLKGRPDYAPVGSYKTECFEIISAFEMAAVQVPEQKNEIEPVKSELPREQWQQMDLFSL